MRQNVFQAFSDLFNWLKFGKVCTGVVFYKTTLSTTKRFNELDFKRKSKRQLQLKTKKRYNLTKPISNDTKEDLLDPTLVTLSTTIKI